jgi:hypothetical protein
MARDSLFGETILWSGAPKDASVSPIARVVMAVSGGVAAVSLAFAVVLLTALHVAAPGLILFAGWCSALGLLAYTAPKLWRTGVQYAVTDKHIIWRRGPIRRSIDRDSISYALIRWSPTTVGVGDLVLVRAVPTGALRRTLSLTLSDVVAPDRVWAIARGITPSAPLGDGARPLPQRLDEGERVVWSGTPVLAPWTSRRVVTASIALGVALAAGRSAERVIPTLGRLAHLHALPGWSFGLFVGAVVVSVLFAAAVAGGVGYVACFRPTRLARATRYLVTNHRVLIRRGREELSLDRAHIADVIASPTRKPLRDGTVATGPGSSLVDLFLVLDGPHARAFASSGAFREGEGDGLLPVLSAIEDSETVDAILRKAVLGDGLATAA